MPKFKKVGDILLLANGLMLAIILNQLASLYFFRLDLTEERRYTIKQPTKELLQNLEDDVYVEVYLEGDLNAPFRRLQKAVRETLEEFRVYSKNKVHYTFLNPASAIGQNAQREFMTSLTSKGIQPMNVIDNKNGQRTETLVFPGAMISYGASEKGVTLLRDHLSQRSEEVLNQSIEGIEFELANAINKLANNNRKKVGILTGHGELDSLHRASLVSTLYESYDVFNPNLTTRPTLQEYDVLILAKPTRLFSERDKYKLDQYLLHGGKLLLLIDELEVNMDSVSSDYYFASPYHLGLEDQLFRYGVRVNQDMVQDIVSLHYPIVTGTVNGKAQITPLEWPLFPMVNHYANHITTRNLDASEFRIVSSMDSVKAEGIRKTPLLFSSDYSRKVKAPVKVNVNDLRKEIKPENFGQGPVVLAYLLEGKFTSLYKNRFLPDSADTSRYLAEGVPSKLIVLADGDVARNEVNPKTGQAQPLGLDNYSHYTFANKELILNMVAYLADETGLISARNKVVKIRPLDKGKLKNDQVFWQVINLVLPILLIISLGITKAWWRKKKYGSFKVSQL